MTRGPARRQANSPAATQNQEGPKRPWAQLHRHGWRPPLAREGFLPEKMGIKVETIGPILEEEGMRVFEYWGGEYKPLEEMLKWAEEERKRA